MVRAPEALRAAAAPYVAVRVTNMKDVDVTAIPFDFDLTMAVVLMHPDGTIYHRYGSRPADDPTAWTTVDGLCELLDATVDEHRAHEAALAERGARPALPEWTPAIEQPPLRRFFADRKPADCIHCHTIHDSAQAHARATGTWRDEQRWVHPEPARVGLTMDPRDQARVAAVAADSPAAAAGLRAGDRLLHLGRQPRVLTISDVMWALHGLAPGATTVDATFARGDERGRATLRLPAGWKATTARDYAWRSFKWGLSPAPGFGGPALDDAQKRRAGIDPAAFAFRVQYLVTWGPKAHRGRAAAEAGVRKGDVMVSFAGRDDFASIAHFHAWVRLHCRAGEEVDVVVLRDGERRTLRYRLPE